MCLDMTPLRCICYNYNNKKYKCTGGIKYELCELMLTIYNIRFSHMPSIVFLFQCFVEQLRNTLCT
jgi:hypothetical protein